VGEREGGGRWWAGVGRKRGIGPPLDKEKEGGEDGLGRRGERIRSLLFFFFFSFLFQIHFKSFANLFKSNLLHLFKFTQISPTILKSFHKPFLTTFQHILNSNLYTKFHKLFHNYFKDFFHK
jgi:hypothetical protein